MQQAPKNQEIKTFDFPAANRIEYDFFCPKTKQVHVNQEFTLCQHTLLFPITISSNREIFLET